MPHLDIQMNPERIWIQQKGSRVKLERILSTSPDPACSNEPQDNISLLIIESVQLVSNPQWIQALLPINNSESSCDVPTAISPPVHSSSKCLWLPELLLCCFNCNGINLIVTPIQV